MRPSHSMLLPLMLGGLLGQSSVMPGPSSSRDSYHRHRSGSTKTRKQFSRIVAKRRARNAQAKASRRSGHGKLSTQRHK